MAVPVFFTVINTMVPMKDLDVLSARDMNLMDGWMDGSVEKVLTEYRNKPLR